MGSGYRTEVLGLSTKCSYLRNHSTAQGSDFDDQSQKEASPITFAVCFGLSNSPNHCEGNLVDLD